MATARMLPAVLLLLLLLLAQPAAAVLQPRRVELAGSGYPALVFDPPGASNNGSRAVYIVLLGFTCPLPAPVVAAMPGGRAAEAWLAPDALAAAFGVEAEALGSVVAVLRAPCSVAACALCAQSAAAASVAPLSWPKRSETLLGAAAYLKVTAGGTACDGVWDAGEPCCLPAAQRRPGGDVPFIVTAVRTVLAATPGTDVSRVYLAGVSAGAFMALRAGCDAPAGVFAGVVAYAGAVPPNCSPPRPLPLVLVHGRKDLEVPFAGSTFPGERFSGAEASLAAWAAGARCTAGVQPSVSTQQLSGGGSTVDVVRYTAGCAAQPVEGWWVEEWPHLPPEAQSSRVFTAAFSRVAGGPPLS